MSCVCVFASVEMEQFWGHSTFMIAFFAFLEISEIRTSLFLVDSRESLISPRQGMHTKNL